MNFLDTLASLAAFAVAVGVVGGIVLGWVGFFRTRALGRRLDRLERAAERGGAAAGTTAETAGEAPRPPPLEPESPPPLAQAAAPAPAAAGAPEGFERALTGRWTVWVGAAALALAGAFLVEYSMSQGWLGPAARCALAAAGGLAAILAGERLRRRGPRRAGAARAPESALTAAGVAVLYGSVYAAHALYGLLPAAPAFAALAAVSAAACALALRHGPTVAALGVGGGYLLPLAVSSDAPSAPALFMFVAALTAVAAWLAQKRGWRFLPWMALAGAALWPALWLAAAWRGNDAAVVGAYLAVAVFLFLFPLPGAGGRRGPAAPAAAAACVFAPLVFALVRVDGYGVSLAALALVCAAYMEAGRRDARLDWLVGAALALVFALAATFHIGQVTDAAGRALGVEGWRYDLGRRATAPATVPFLSFCAAFATLFAAAGFAALWRARRRWLWAGVSAAAPVGLLAIAYWRIAGFQTDGAWAGAAVATAAAAVLAAERLARHRDRRGMEGALAAYAAGAAAALGLGLAALLETAWLTVALSLFVPALAAIHDRLPLAGLRHVALAAAGVVIVRLLFNVRVLEYPDGGLPGLDWALYGYGVPLAAFGWAARGFGAHGRGALVRVLEAGALAFGVALAFWQARAWIAGDVAAPSFAFSERALHAAAWLAIAWALFRRAEGYRRDVLGWGWRLLASGAALWVVAVQAVFDGPLTHPFDVGAYPVLNLLLLAYGLPALFAAGFLRVARARGRGGDRAVAAIAGPLALALAFVWLTLEVRRAFHGGVLSEGGVGDAEAYAWTMAWLAYAGVLLAFGMRRRAAGPRRASLVLLALTTAKLFLFDMAALEGLYRVASFLGLGLSLIGIGYLYRRFVFPPPRGAAAAGGA